MPNDESLHAPSPEVTEGKPVEVAPYPLPRDIPAVRAVFLRAEIPP